MKFFKPAVFQPHSSFRPNNPLFTPPGPLLRAELQRSFNGASTELSRDFLSYFFECKPHNIKDIFSLFPFT